MKNAIINAALVAGAICLSSNLHAQEMQQAEQAATEKATKNSNQNILNGAWSILLDKHGCLHIVDKDSHSIRMIEGVGPAIQKSNGSVFNSPATYPVRLYVDKAGDLHIDDVSVYTTSSQQPIRIYSPDRNSFGDPDRPENTNEATAQIVHQTAKPKQKVVHENQTSDQKM